MYLRASPVFVIVTFANGSLLSYGLCPGNPPEGKLYRGEGHGGGQGYGKVLEVLGRTPVSSEAEEGASTTQRRGRATKPFLSSFADKPDGAPPSTLRVRL